VFDVTAPFSQPYAIGGSGNPGNDSNANSPGGPGNSGGVTSIASVFNVNGGGGGGGAPFNTGPSNVVGADGTVSNTPTATTFSGSGGNLIFTNAYKGQNNGLAASIGQLHVYENI
jgi:hypothetical protein